MVAKKKPDFDPAQLDQLLDLDTIVDESVTEDAKEADTVAETPVAPAAPEKSANEIALEKQLAELQAQMAQILAAQASAVPAATSFRPKPAEELTAEERHAREEADKRARENARRLENAPERFEEIQSDDTILIHFLEDGFTALGRTWYRGQELEFDLHGEAYEATKDRNGRSWLEDTEADQGRRYKKLYWRRGPWLGDGYADDAAAQAERQRSRKAPIPATV